MHISGFQENNKMRKKLFPKEGSTNLQQNDGYARSSIKNQTKKPASLSSVPNKNMLREKSKSEFIIPELPEGRLLEIKIYSNWGDKYLVGMNGIELFDMHGNAVNIEKVRLDISALSAKNSNDQILMRSFYKPSREFRLLKIDIYCDDLKLQSIQSIVNTLVV